MQQFARPAAPVLLAVAGLSPTPVPNLLFGVYLDPLTTLATSFGIVDASGVRTLDFVLPAGGVPSGTRLSMQAFELLPSGEVLASNATNAGLW